MNLFKHIEVLLSTVCNIESMPHLRLGSKLQFRYSRGLDCIAGTTEFDDVETMP